MLAVIYHCISIIQKFAFPACVLCQMKRVFFRNEFLIVHLKLQSMPADLDNRKYRKPLNVGTHFPVAVQRQLS